MTTWMVVACLQVFIVSVARSAITGHISFSDYCEKDINPEVLPASGKFSGGILSMNALDSKTSWYQPGMNCNVTFSTPSGYQLLIAFSRISLRNSSLDSLTVESEDSMKLTVLSGDQKCPNENCSSLKFESGKVEHNMTFHFVSANISVPLNYSGFKAAYTVFDMTGKGGGCKKDRFLCKNAHCISKELVCDGHNNCGDLSDEFRCSIPAQDTVWGIVVIAIAVASIVLFVPLFCFLASYGTRSIVKSVTLPNHSVPLYSAVNDNETANLLTSSIYGPPYTEYWSSRSYDRRDTYGTAYQFDNQPSTSGDARRSQSCSGGDLVS